MGRIRKRFRRVIDKIKGDNSDKQGYDQCPICMNVFPSVELNQHAQGCMDFKVVDEPKEEFKLEPRETEEPILALPNDIPPVFEQEPEIVSPKSPPHESVVNMTCE